MEREQYMIDLQRALNNCFSQKQSDDVLADYTGFFDAGIAEGKSESELCMEFGSPESVARELLRNNPMAQKQKSIYLHLKISLILAAIAIFLLLPFSDWSNLLFSSAFILFISAALQAIIVVGDCNSSAIPVDSRLYRIRQKWFSGRRLILLLLIPLTIFACQCVWLANNRIFYVLYAAVLAFVAFICVVRSVYPAKSESFRYIKIILTICYPFLAVLFVPLFILVNMQDKQFIDRGDSGPWFVILLSAIITLSVFTGILATIYAIHKTAEAKWLIFLSTTFFSFAFGIIHVLGCSSKILNDTFSSIQFSIAQNVTVLVLSLLFFHLQKKIKVKRRVRYERADEKGNS